MAWYGIVWCGMVRYGTVGYAKVWHGIKKEEMELN